jgi:tetratricopeptide (TPR) repeat protein
MADASAQRFPSRVFVWPSNETSLDESTQQPFRVLGLKVLATANQVKRSQLVTGFSRTFPIRVGRLLKLREMAIDSERKGHYTRSDFLWRTIHRSLGELSGREEDWKRFVCDLCAQNEAEIVPRLESIRGSFVRELFVDLHIALYRGFLEIEEAPGSEHRCFVHVQWARKLVRDCLQVPLEDIPETLQATRHELQVGMRDKNWTTAWKLALELVRGSPANEELVESAQEIALTKLNSSLSKGESKRDFTENAAAAQVGIQQLEEIRALVPNIPSVYHHIGELYCLRAVNLANSGELAEALESIQRAVTFNPAMEEAWQTRDKLIKLMKDLQKKMEVILRQLRFQPNASLNSDGEEMRRQSVLGLSLMENYANSRAPLVVQADRRRAQAQSVWKEIGFDAPGENEERAVTLLGALEEVAGKGLKSEARIRAAWQEVSTDNPELAALDAEAMVEFLAGRLLKGRRKPARRKQTSGGERMEVPRPAAIVPAAASRRASFEPPVLWLFAREAFFAKLLAMVALIAILTTALWGITEQRNRRTRDIAYEQVISNGRQGNRLAVLDAAERFLSARVSGEDAREETVRSYYDEAFVRWFVSQDRTTEASQKHLATYRVLSADAPTMKE